MREMISAYALFAIPIAQPMSSDANRKTAATNASRSPATAMHAVKAAIVAAAVAMTAFWRRRDRSTTSGDNAFPAMKPMLKVG